MLCDRPIGREEALCLTQRLKPLHAPLALTSGLVGVFRAIVEIPMLAMFHAGENLSLRAYPNNSLLVDYSV